MAITDLTNTTWEIPAGWTATAGYGQFSVNGSFTETTYLGGGKFNKISIGFVPSGNTYSNSISLYITEPPAFEGETLYANSYVGTFTFTGGTDVTNTSLISWLETHGTLQGGETEQTDTKPIYKRVNGAWVKLTAFERVNGAWVKISSAGEAEEPEQPEVDDSIVGTWMWNETIDLSTSFKFYPMPEGTTYSTYNSTLYGLMTYYDSGLRTTYFYLTNADGTIGGNWLYSDKDGWQYDVYKYISFANDTDNEELRAYLKANATKV